MIRLSDFDGRFARLRMASTPGHGPQLIMLHGVTRRWQTFLPVMHGLHLRWQVHAIDMRGHGGSTRVAGSYRVTDYIEDVVDLVERNSDPAVILYGHSLGAMVAAGAAARLGSKVNALIMEDPPFHTMGHRIHQNILHSFFGGLSNFASHQYSLKEAAQRLGDIPLFDPATGKHSFMRDSRDAAALRFNAESLRQVDPEVFVTIKDGTWLEGYDPVSIARKLTCPTLLLQADIAAGGMLTDADAEEFTQAAADVTRLRLSGIGHVIHTAQTSLLVNLVSGFLESAAPIVA